MPRIVLTLYADSRKVSERHSIQPGIYELGRLIEKKLMGEGVTEAHMRAWGVTMAVEEDMDQGDE